MFVYLCVWVVITILAAIVAFIFEKLAEGAGEAIILMVLGMCITYILIENGII